MSWTSPSHSIIPTVGIINYCLCFFLSALPLYYSHRFMDSFRLSQGLSLCSADRCRTTSRDLSTASHSFSLVSFDRHSVLIKVPFFFIAKFPLWEFCFIKAISHSFHIHIFCCSCGPFSYKSLFDSHSGNRTTFSICQSVALPSKFIALPSDSISSNQLCSKS